MCREAAISLFPGPVEVADEGNMDAVKILMSVCIHNIRNIFLPVEVPSGPAGIISAMKAGEIQTDTASEAMAVHMPAARIEEISKLREVHL